MRNSTPKLWQVLGGAVDGPQTSEDHALTVQNWYTRAGRLVRRKGSAPLYNDVTVGEKELLLWTRLGAREYLLAVDGDTGSLQDHFQSPPATVTGGGAAFSPYAETNAAWLDNRLFLGQGAGQLQRFDGTTLVRALPDTPDSSRVNAFWVAGNPPYVVDLTEAVTVRYRFAWVGADGQYGLATAATSAVVVASSTSIFLQGLPSPPGGQGIQGLAVFRSETGTDAPFLYAGTVPSGAVTYVDHATDLELGDELQIANSAMPSCKYLVTWQERLVGGWTATDAATLFISNEREPWYCPVLPDITDPTQGTRLSLQDFDGGDLTGLAVHGSYLIAFTRNRGFLLAGDQPSNFQLREFSPVGCVAHRTIQSTQAGLLWLGPDGVYSWNGASVERVSDPLYDTFHGKSAAELALGSAVVWDNRYILSFPSTGFTAAVTAASAPLGTSIPADYIVWFKADAIAGATDGSSVLLWPDSSGNGYHTRNTTNIASGAPTYVASSLNGLPAVRTNPTRTCSIPANVMPKQAGKSWTFFYLGKLSRAESSNPILTAAGNATGEYSLSLYPFDNNSDTGPPDYGSVSWYDNNSGDPYNGSQFGTVTGGTTVWAIRLNKSGASGSSWVNGHALTSNPFGSGTYTTSGTALGGPFAVTIPGNCSADTTEMLLYPRALTDAEVGAVNTYLKARGGIV